MKIATLLRLSVGFCFAFLLGKTNARASWTIVGPPHFTSTAISTVGGVTYFTHTSDQLADGCYAIRSGPVVQAGTNISQEIYKEHWYDPNTLCTQDAHSETHVSVLGALAPGEYLFSVISEDALFGGKDVIASWGFVVPSSETFASVVNTNQFCQITIKGVPSVEYVIQGTTNMTNWTSVYTNVGGPFVWNAPMNNSNCFYRTVINGR